MPSGKIRYRIHSDNEDAKYFRIDSLNGLITNFKRLDREIKDSYSIIIEASDMGEPPQSTTRVLNINVLDVDDHKPRFERELDSTPIELGVMEEQPLGTFVAVISAVDEDIGENGAIDYAIIDGNELEMFDLVRSDDNKATLRTAKVIDREQFESFTLTVKCFKLSKQGYKIRKPYTAKDKSEIQFVIKIIDIDDHLPEFSSNETVGVRHNVPINTLITTIKISDADSTAEPVHLSIQHVNFVSQFYRKTNITVDLNEIFVLVDGEVRNAKALYDFVDGYFELKIRANNSLVPRRARDNKLKIFVIRDKSLLTFVFSKPPSEVMNVLPEFSGKIKEELKKSELDLSIFDAQVLSRPDYSLDFTATSSCFQLSRHGNPLTPHDMHKLMESEQIYNSLIEIYVNYSVKRIDNCASGRIQTAQAVSSGMFLVLLAGGIGLASMMALASTCCLFNR